MKILRNIVVVTSILCVLPADAQFYRGMVDVAPALEIPEDLAVTNVYDGKTVEVTSFGYDKCAFAWGVSTTHGVQLNEHHYVGLGVEFTMFIHKTLIENLGSIPIYAMWRMDFFGRKVTPFFDVRGGCQVAETVGFYGNINGGMRIALKEKLGLNLSLGMRMRRASYCGRRYYGRRYYTDDKYAWIWPVDEGESYGASLNYKNNVFGVVMRIGFDF